VGVTVLLTAALLPLSAGIAAGAETAVLSVWAARATQEAREGVHVDPALEPIRQSLRGLPFNTYRSLLTARPACPMGEETRLRVTAHYTLVVKPLERKDGGRLCLEVRIEMPPHPDSGRTEPVAALSTVVNLSPNRQIKLGGLKLEEGELVLVLAAD
jgi:hypothetical protein